MNGHWTSKQTNKHHNRDYYFLIHIKTRKRIRIRIRRKLRKDPRNMILRLPSKKMTTHVNNNKIRIRRSSGGHLEVIWRSKPVLKQSAM